MLDKSVEGQGKAGAGQCAPRRIAFWFLKRKEVAHAKQRSDYRSVRRPSFVNLLAYGRDSCGCPVSSLPADSISHSELDVPALPQAFRRNRNHFVRSDPATRTPGTAAREDRPEIVNHLGTRVREVRRMRGLSQSKLAQLMKVPRTYISKVEMSRTVPTIATLYRMAS